MSEKKNPMSNAPRNFRPEPYGYHEEIELDIETLTNMGQGLGRINEWVVMVRFALPGERVRARVYRNDKNFSEADLVEVITPSPSRIAAPCPVFTECGGCQYQHFEYSAQLEWKTKQVKELLWHMVRIDHPVQPAIASPKEYGYRSKLTPHFEVPHKGRPMTIGFLKAGTRSRHVEVKHCPLISDAMNETLTQVRADTYAQQEKKPFKKGGTLLIREHLDGVTTDPKETIREQVGDITFSFIAGEFFQNNPSILPAFTGYVRDKARDAGAKYLVDAYCGSGLFTLTAAKDFEKVVGIEISEQSIDYAVQNAAANEIENASFVLGDAASIFEQIEFAGNESAVVIDPPRKGSSEDFLNQLIAFGPRSVIYVSCNPATQMRDLQVLLAGGYHIEEIQPFDLFPQTRHLECVVVLKKA